ncbi:outer membrane protein Iml2/Tetratricopeptide repeat protein 39 [Paraphysoderma sedebokerense]|nr:outer membrane protein Iml2/Tetratricopeptide repeat protein 39 [Paraphysoderma sedebokerense]
MFFNNRFKEAQELLSKTAETDCVGSMGVGVLGLLKALTTFNQADIEYTGAYLSQAEAIASIQNDKAKPKSSGGIGKWISSSANFLGEKVGLTSSPPMSPAELRSIVVRAEASSLYSLVLLFQESIIGFIKAGLGFRRAYTLYGKAYNDIRKFEEDSPGQLHLKVDKHTLGGAQFGIGIINVILSILPPKILRVISVLGYTANKELGYELLRKAAKTNGFRAPLSELFMGSYDTIISSFAPTIVGPALVASAIESLQTALNRYPNSSFHLLLMGRVLRIGKRLDLSTTYLNQSQEAQNEWKELHSLNDYEIALNHLMSLNWEKAIERFEKLKKGTYWSTSFFTFALGSCYEMLSLSLSSSNPELSKQHHEKATELFKAAPGYVNRKFGGRVVSVEQYVIRKVKLFEQDDFKKTMVPGLELVYLWNGYTSMDTPTLRASFDIVDPMIKLYETLNSETTDAYYYDRLGILKLIRAAIYEELGEYEVAERDLLSVFDNEKKMKEEKWVMPFGTYQMGVLTARRGDLEEAKKWLAKARDKYSDYNLEFRLAFRIHIALTQINEWSKNGVTPDFTMPSPENLIAKFKK